MTQRDICVGELTVGEPLSSSLLFSWSVCMWSEGLLSGRRATGAAVCFEAGRGGCVKLARRAAGRTSAGFVAALLKRTGCGGSSTQAK